MSRHRRKLQLVGAALMLIGCATWRLGHLINNEAAFWGMSSVFVGMMVLIAIEGRAFFESD